MHIHIFSIIYDGFGYACSWPKIGFIDAGNVYCMPIGNMIHVPRINEIYLCPELCISTCLCILFINIYCNVQRLKLRVLYWEFADVILNISH